MTSEETRPTVRPVTISRLIEVTHLCGEEKRSTEDIEEELRISHRRVRETILEATRIGLIDEAKKDIYETTESGSSFLDSVKAENWLQTDKLLREHSPHYRHFVDVVESISPVSLDDVLKKLDDSDDSHRTYNQTSVEVLGDWSERLGSTQRNAFTGNYYRVREDKEVPEDFDSVLLSVYDELEETAGVNLRQRHIPIPELREHFCEKIGCNREVFDRGLLTLTEQNIGKMELSGAPIDTGAKDSLLGIKEMELSNSEGLVSTSQSTDRVMSGVEQHGKQYYYLAVYDRDIGFSKEETR
jgi:Mn-dependent DtxR family transcriptional regulator